MNQSSPARLDFLDSLRGIAILLVMALHYWEFTWFNLSIGPVDLNFLVTTGSIGVTLFFFVSGFCLYLSYDRAPDKLLYARKRFFKIVPSYALAIAIILAVFGAPAWGFREFAWQLMTHALFVHNWWPDTYGSINGVFWSLAVEVQFYFLFPFFYPWVKRRPLTTLGLTYLGAQIARLYISATNPNPLDQYLNQLPPLLDVFVAGIASAHWYSLWRTGPKPWFLATPARATAVAVAGLFLSGACFHLAHVERYNIGIPQIQVWLRGALLISFSTLSLGSAFALGTWNRLLANPLLRFLSRISYNLYIWHQFIGLKFFEAKIPEYVGDPHEDKAWRYKFLILAISVSILVSWLITIVFEEPILRAGTRKRPAA
ncbi:MAG: acyltransferase [Bdellovibrionia bacterium]